MEPHPLPRDASLEGVLQDLSRKVCFHDFTSISCMTNKLSKLLCPFDRHTTSIPPQFNHPTER